MTLLEFHIEERRLYELHRFKYRIILCKNKVRDVFSYSLMLKVQINLGKFNYNLIISIVSMRDTFSSYRIMKS